MPIFASAQEKLSYQTIIHADSIKKEIIYSGIKEWIGMNYQSAKAVIEVDDKESGLLVINPVSTYTKSGFGYQCYAGYLKYSIKIEMKENKFRVIITNFTHESKNSSACSIGLITTDEDYTRGGMSKGANNKVWHDIKDKTQAIADDLFASLSKISFKIKKEDNW